ncbi:MAG: DUF3472 domain-containing protein [Clostridia bacterium]|nr:DUF3472 domain-containing protein [Clostridia bacterium]
MEKMILVPLGGNSFITNKPQSQQDDITPDGWTAWENAEYEYHIFFKPAVSATISPVLLLNPIETASTIKVKIGDTEATLSVPAGAQEIALGEYTVAAGYVDVMVQGLTREGDVFAFPHTLKVGGIDDAEMASYARESDRNDFYWIRRGPSVHCGYDVTVCGDDVQWFYNEARVDPGDDPHGTYCMAIGFHGGYFGMQVCDEGERKVLFSIWSPFVTDDPSEIPEDKMVKVLKKHPLVKTGEFGNEGSGGQSYMNYNWVSGETYRFLCRITPRENNKTEFTAYFFFPESGKWELLCSFLRPETQTWFRGAYSFLESFIDVNGHNYRRAHFQNQWAVTKAGKWVPINHMKLTGDATARKAQRQDYGGGVVDNHFYLNNCGFFSPNDKLDTIFETDASKYVKPEIDLDALEKAID